MVDNIYNLKTIIITLDPNSINRAQKTMKNIRQLGFSHVDFFNGVKGSDLEDTEIHDLISVRSFFELYKGRCVHEGLSGKGSIGCYLSHVNAWKYCIDIGEPIVVVEDDFTPTEKAKELLPKIYEEAKKLDYGILRLGYFEMIEHEDKKQISKYLTTDHSLVGTICYIITPKAALAALKSAFPMELQVDFYLSRLAYRGDVIQFCSASNVYDISSGDKSTIGHNKLVCQKVKPWYKIAKDYLYDKYGSTRTNICAVALVVAIVLFVLFVLYKIRFKTILYKGNMNPDAKPFYPKITQTMNPDAKPFYPEAKYKVSISKKTGLPVYSFDPPFDPSTVPVYTSL